METVAFCEIEDYPVSILKSHWPNVPVYRDIRELDGKQFRGKIDIVCGGFPCQPFSVAGKQKGQADDRHLWPEMFRIIQESKPSWVVCENVTGLVRLGLDDVLLDLENEGFTSQSLIIPACAVGGSHRRDRVWIIAHAEHNGFSAATVDGSEQKAVRDPPEGKDETVQLEGICSAGNVAETNSSGLQGYTRPKQDKGKRQESLGQSVNEGFSRNWQPIRKPTQPAICLRNNGVPDRVARLKALGNAVVPQIPELIGRSIILANNC